VGRDLLARELRLARPAGHETLHAELLILGSEERREVQALDKDQPIYNVRTMDDMRKRQDAMVAQLQGTLPPERLADLKMATDPEYQQINRLVARLVLAPGHCDARIIDLAA